MTASLLVLILATALLIAAFGGAWVLRHAAPALAAVPRLSAIALTTAALLWITAFLAIGPVVAWMSDGPSWLPEQAEIICSRCLSASTAFGESIISFGIPATIPLAVPALGVFAVAAGLIREFRQQRRSQRTIAADVAETAHPMTIFGLRVQVLDSDELRAFSLPRNQGGIVLSRGALLALSEREITAVIEHERAHLSQRHHLLLTVLGGATRYFRWVPFIRAVRGAVPHYLEIAADQSAKRVTGAVALASALLKLGDAPAPGFDRQHAVLHAAGSARIRDLLGQHRPPASLALAAAAGIYAFSLLAVVTAVHLPYALALLTGC